MIHLQAYHNTNLKFLHIKKEMLCNVALCKLGKREMNHEPQNFYSLYALYCNYILHYIALYTATHSL